MTSHIRTDTATDAATVHFGAPPIVARIPRVATTLPVTPAAPPVATPAIAPPTFNTVSAAPIARTAEQRIDRAYHAPVPDAVESEGLAGTLLQLRTAAAPYAGVIVAIALLMSAGLVYWLMLRGTPGAPRYDEAIGIALPDWPTEPSWPTITPQAQTAPDPFTFDTVQNIVDAAVFKPAPPSPGPDLTFSTAAAPPQPLVPSDLRATQFVAATPPELVAAKTKAKEAAVEPPLFATPERVVAEASLQPPGDTLAPMYPANVQFNPYVAEQPQSAAGESVRR